MSLLITYGKESTENGGFVGGWEAMKDELWRDPNFAVNAFDGVA